MSTSAELWPNTQEKQLRKGKIYIGSQFLRVLQSIVSLFLGGELVEENITMAGEGSEPVSLPHGR